MQLNFNSGLTHQDCMTDENKQILRQIDKNWILFSDSLRVTKHVTIVDFKYR